jgi:hypothetical protein
MEIFYRNGNFLPLPSRGTFLKRHEEHAAASRPKRKRQQEHKEAPRKEREEQRNGRKE